MKAKNGLKCTFCCCFYLSIVRNINSILNINESLSKTYNEYPMLLMTKRLRKTEKQKWECRIKKIKGQSCLFYKVKHFTWYK